MKKCTAYKFEFAEAQEVLRNCLDDATVKLRKNGDFYEAVSDNQFLDGGQVDERFAQILGVSECKQYAIGGEVVVLVEDDEEVNECYDICISDLIDLLEEKNNNKTVVVQLPNGIMVVMDSTVFVEDEIVYLFKNSEDEKDVLTNVGRLKKSLELESENDCWDNGLFNQSGPRFEDCQVRFVNATFEEFDNEDFNGEIYSLSSEINETVAMIVFGCLKE